MARVTLLLGGGGTGLLVGGAFGARYALRADHVAVVLVGIRLRVFAGREALGIALL